MKKQVEIDVPEYQRLKECLSEIYPQIKVELIETDEALYKLGFVDKIPCKVDIYATEEQVDEILEITRRFEEDAYADDFSNENSFEYLKYQKYGWLWDFFYYFYKAELNENRN